MKKIFSLVALAGMFALMSFSFKANSNDIVVLTNIDICNELAIEFTQTFDLSLSDSRSFYYACIAAN